VRAWDAQVDKWGGSLPCARVPHLVLTSEFAAPLVPRETLALLLSLLGVLVPVPLLSLLLLLAAPLLIVLALEVVEVGGVRALLRELDQVGHAH